MANQQNLRGESDMQEMRRTLSEHTDAIARVRADVEALHRDNDEVKETLHANTGLLHEMKAQVSSFLAAQEARPKSPGLASMLAMAMSAFVIFGFIVGGLKYFINSEVEAKNILLEYRVAHMEAAISWTPSFVPVTTVMKSAR